VLDVLVSRCVGDAMVRHRYPLLAGVGLFWTGDPHEV